MPKRKVIEDSDDEEDHTEPTPPHSPTVASRSPDATAGHDLNARSANDDGQLSAHPSTSSTELLNREIRAAHKSLIEPSSESSLRSTKNPSSSQQQSQVDSTTMSRTKLKRAVTSAEKPRAKKPLKRYGTESRSFNMGENVFDFRVDSDGDFENIHADRKRFVLDEKYSQTDSPSSPSESSATRTTTMTASKRLDIQGQNGSPDCSVKSSMPPPASKTAILDHTRIPETVSVTSGLCPPDAPDASDSCMDHTISSPGLNGDDGPEQAPPMPTGSLHESREPVDDELAVELPKHHNLDSIKSSFSKVGESNGDKSVDELSLALSGPSTWSINQTTMSKSQKRKLSHDQLDADEPKSDEIAIGLPGDRYQPRPSKSRSNRGNDEVIIPSDFSKRPEALGKKLHKSKRRKTTAFHELRPMNEREDTADGVDPQSKLEGFEEDTADGVAPESKVEDLETKLKVQPSHEEEQKGDKTQNDTVNEASIQSAPEKPKKGRGRPKKAANLDATEGHLDTENNEKSTGVNVNSEKARDQAPKGKKGDKSKSKAPAISEELVSDSDGEPDVDTSMKQPRNVLVEKQGNAISSQLAKEVTAPSSPTKFDIPAPETPRKPISLEDKGPDKHSPISSGKVAYRVGLSKRARIAPLLRMVRKT